MTRRDQLRKNKHHVDDLQWHLNVKRKVTSKCAQGCKTKLLLGKTVILFPLTAFPPTVEMKHLIVNLPTNTLSVLLAVH